MAPSSTLDKYPPSTAFDEIIEIKVGSPNPKSFFMHKGVLCYYSGYFATALAKDNWLESKNRVFDFDTEDVHVFESFQYWTYARRFAACEDHINDKNDGWLSIIDLWILGDRREIPLLQNEAINLFRRKVVATWTIPDCHIDRVYTNTTPDSTLRKFLIDLVGKTKSFQGIEAEYIDNRFTRDALVDLLRVIWEGKCARWSKEDVAALDMCQYHVHEEGVKCVTVSTDKGKTTKSG